MVAWSVVAAVTAFVAWQFHPRDLVSATTPAFADLGAHLHEPAFLRDHLLPHGRLSGWSQDWFAGYPSLTFYFPLGSLLIVVLDLLLPYTVAFKVVAAAGPVVLPVSAYAFGRLNRRDRLTSACFAVGTLPLLLEPSLRLAGGSIGAAGIGEYGYGLSLASGLLVLGLVRAGLTTGRRRALAAGLLAVTLLLHLLPALIVILGLGVCALLQREWSRTRWTLSVLAAAAALVGFWAVPFVVQNTFTAGPDYPRAVPLAKWLFPNGMVLLLVLAVIGAAVSLVNARRERDDLGVFLVAMAAVSAVVFVVTPTGRVWNARFLAPWFLWLCLLAAEGVARLAAFADEQRRLSARGRSLDRPALARNVAPVLLLLAILPLWDTRLGRGLLTRDQTDTRRVVRDNFGGYERSAYRAEFDGFIGMLRSVARDHGCGRMQWEYEATDWGDYRGTLMTLSPYFTDGCIEATEGLFSQSSATSPFVNLTNTRLSPTPAVYYRSLGFDVAKGVEDLRILGVRYFVATSPATQTAADALPGLRPVGRTEPRSGRFWKAYEVPGVEVVEPLRHEPVIVHGIGASRSTWEKAAQRWYEGDERDVVAAEHGLDTWARRSRLSEALPRKALPDAPVSRVRIDHDRVSFRVSRTGVPILVKVSYFPNWRVSGADGPWRVTPNQMVVVPTSPDVVLRYGRAPAEYAGWALTGVGIGGLVLLVRSRPTTQPDRKPAEQEPRAQRPPPGRRKQKRKRRRG